MVFFESALCYACPPLLHHQELNLYLGSADGSTSFTATMIIVLYILDSVTLLPGQPLQVGVDRWKKV